MYKLSDYDYCLPQEKIAKYPLKQRSASKLLVAKQNGIIDTKFSQLTEHLFAGDLLVFNDTKVIAARLQGNKLKNGRMGGAAELFIESIVSEYTAIVRCKMSNPRIGTEISFQYNHKYSATFIEKCGEFWKIKSNKKIVELIKHIGKVPIPPYLQRSAEPIDKVAYQTVYAEHFGAAAAPTAGLHFDSVVFNKIKKDGINIAYLTLHVGSGTFIPIRTENILDHKIHSERIKITEECMQQIIKAKKKGKRIIAVGTTTLRALETIAMQQETGIHSNNYQVKNQKFSGTSNIYILPNHEFKIVDCLITNFHQPKSTLLILVSAFAGFENIKRIYQHALDNNYRFLSYGDSMLLQRKRSSEHDKIHPDLLHI